MLNKFASQHLEEYPMKTRLEDLCDQVAVLQLAKLENAGSLTDEECQDAGKIIAKILKNFVTGYLKEMHNAQ